MYAGIGGLAVFLHSATAVVISLCMIASDGRERRFFAISPAATVHADVISDAWHEKK